MKSFIPMRFQAQSLLMDDLNAKNQKLANRYTQRAFAALNKEYAVVGKTRVRSGHAWLVIGLAVGLTLGIALVANRSGEMESAGAAAFDTYLTEQILGENVEELSGPQLIALEKKVRSKFEGNVYATSTPWNRHKIDDGSPTAKGADGVRLADADKDGDTDIVTGWEGSGHIRVMLNPGSSALNANPNTPWIIVNVGVVQGPEDAVFVDLDNDGVTDVVSSTEGGKTIFVHWGPKEAATNKNKYADASLWNKPSGKPEPIPDSQGFNWLGKKNIPGFQNSTWMFTVPMDANGDGRVDLVSGGKGGTWVGWFESPLNPRDLGAWKFHPVYDSGWLMSMAAKDMDGDLDLDIYLSPRTKGSTWLENPGHAALQSNPEAAWTRRDVGKYHKGLSMFQTTGDLDKDGLEDVVLANRAYTLVYHHSNGSAANSANWDSYLIRVPGDRIFGTPKGAAVGDINLDGKKDIVVSAEHAGSKSGMMWISYRISPTDGFKFDSVQNAYVGGIWDAHEIGGRGSSQDKRGAKFDIIELLDLDGDGDLDVIACEEAHGLGVFWYENPTL